MASDKVIERGFKVLKSELRLARSVTARPSGHCNL